MTVAAWTFVALGVAYWAYVSAAGVRTTRALQRLVDEPDAGPGGTATVPRTSIVVAARDEGDTFRHEVDVLALQETKAREDQLPLMGIQALGYDVVVSGTNQWNGVAILSRVGVEDVEEGFPGQPGWGEPAEPESRALGATCGGVRLWSLYIPNGRKPDDPHYVYKLDWLARLRDTWRRTVWLNPQPEAWWDGYRSIQIVRRLLEDRMYPLTLAGLDGAIRALR